MSVERGDGNGRRESSKDCGTIAVYDNLFRNSGSDGTVAVM